MTRWFVSLALPFALVSPAYAQRSIVFDEASLPERGVLAVAVSEGLAGADFEKLDTASQGALRRAATAAGYKGEKGSKLDLPGFANYERVLLVGTGKGSVDTLGLRDYAGTVAQHFVSSHSGQPVHLYWGGAQSDAATQLAMGVALGQYRFDKYKSGEAKAATGDLVIRTPSGRAAQSAWERDWQPVARAVNFARDLISEPANTIYPESFVARVREEARRLPVTLEVLDVPAMEKLGMGGMLSVGQGSMRPPRMLVVRYNGGNRGDAPVAFVGKGITFDSGGISIKGNDGMWRMKYDMAGAASSVAAVLGMAGRGAPVNAVAVAALAENMPSGSADRPGDVIRTASGKTFEVISTDAEGRMVLVDALWYVQRQDKPKVIIDIATLTGSIVTALGEDYAGLFTRDDNLANQLYQSGQNSGNWVWRMPLLDSYGPMLASPIADMRNGGGRPGSGTAAWFLGEWVERGTSWAHVDIAGMAWRESNGTPTSPAGATAFGVLLFDQYVRDHHQGK